MIVDEVADQESRAPLLHYIGEEAKGHVDICPGMFRCEINDFPDDQKDMLPSLFGRNEFFDFVAEKYHPDLVVVLNRGKCESRCHFCHFLFLLLSAGAEIAATAHIDKEHHRQFAFLLVDLHIRLVMTRSHIPVDVADVIARFILAHL